MDKHRFSRTTYLLSIVLIISIAANIALFTFYPNALSRIPEATSPQGTWYIDTLVAQENWSAEDHAYRLSRGWAYFGLQHRAVTDLDTDHDIDYQGDFHVYTWSINNIWTNGGMNRTQHKLGNPSLVSGHNTLFAQYVSVHTSLADGTCAYTSTTLASEAATNGLSRAAGTFVAGTASAGDVRWNQTKSFAVTGTTTGINATGLWTDSSAGLLFACGQFAPTNVANGDTLQVRHSSNMTNVRFAYYGLIVSVVALTSLMGWYTSKMVRRVVGRKNG